MWHYPLRPPVLINFFETILSWPVIHLVVRWGISHFFTATRNRTEGVGEKDKRTNEQYGLGSTQSARRVVLWHCIPCAFVDYRGRVFARNFYKLLGMPTHLWPSSSLSLDSTSHRLHSSAVRYRLPLCVSFRQLLSGFLYQLALWLLSDLPFLPSSGLVGDLEFNPFVWFRAKTDKRIVCFADHPYSVTKAHLGR